MIVGDEEENSCDFSHELSRFKASFAVLNVFINMTCMCVLLQVSAEPVCQDVFGPPISGNQQDLWPTGCGFDLALYVR